MIQFLLNSCAGVLQMQKQKEKIAALDKDWFYRWLHLHCFSHIYHILTSKSPKSQFAYPRFQLFKNIFWQNDITYPALANLSLFVRCLITFWKEVTIGGMITIFFSCLNFLIPLMIKSFLHFMHEHHVDKEEISSTEILIESFIVLQLLRIIFGEHSKRLFYELAIKIQSSLSLMIVKKSLTMANQVRNKVSQSEILHLQNIDLRLTFIMFQNMHMAIQAPFTILCTIYLLYLQNYKYGLIGIYWFIIAFLIQRQLDQKMRHCNETKLKLIEARSKINYEIIGKIRTAKLLGHEELLIQKNNDYFIAQNHDHKMFYEYMTLYDISLLILPIVVIITITFYDMNETNPITVSQVYVLLSLMGICYMPMKSFRTLTLSFHDGLRSMKRIQKFLKQPNQPNNQKLIITIPNSKKSRKGSFSSSNSKLKSSILKNSISSQSSLQQMYSKSKTLRNQPLLIIQKNLTVTPAKQVTRIHLQINTEEDLKFYPGERLVVVGKVGSGIEIFFDSLIGLAKIDHGSIHLNDRLAYLNEEHFFRNTTVRENIRFFNKDISDQQIQRVYRLLKLDEDLKLTPGLEGNIDDEYKYNSVQLHKIAIARILCSNAQIYLLDKVFQPLNSSDEKLLQEILRQKQSQGKLIILVNYPNTAFQSDDKVLMLDKGKVKELKAYHQLQDSNNKDFKNFYQIKTQQEQNYTLKQKDIFSHFSSKLSLKFGSMDEKVEKATEAEKKKVIDDFGNSVLVYGVHLWKQYKQQSHQKITNYGIRHYVWKFMSAVKLKEFVYILMIIAVAELMHIFIHFYIGHLEEEHGDNNYSKFRNLILAEFVLTLGLAGVIWLEGEVSSQIAIIQGNQLYKNALTSLGQNKLSWFQKEYSVKIANRFNHDYQQVFIMLHMFLNIYKNIVILLATIYFLSSSKKQLLFMTFAITVTYFTLYWIVRTVQRKVVDFFQEFKYHYVRVLEESIGGARLIEAHGATQALLANAKTAYKQFASYKIASSYTAYGQQILCDLLSLVIFSVVLIQGLQSKVEGNTKSIAEIATMIHLLIGVFDVLKIIVKESVNMETFFKINLLPFVEIIKQKTPQTQKIEEYIAKCIIEFEEEVIKKSEEIKSEKALSNKSLAGSKSSVVNINTFSPSPVKQEESPAKSPRSSKQTMHRVHTVQHSSMRSSSKMRRTISIQRLISPFIKYEIQFRNVILHESKYHEPVFEVYPLNLKIHQGEKVMFYEQNDYLKNYLIYALTKNLPMFFNPQVISLERTHQEIKNKDKTILIGGRDICCIDKQELSQIVQILTEHDFYIQGTLEDNIAWKNHNYDPVKVAALADYLQFRRELPAIKKHGLKAQIKDPSKELIKKMTVLRILSLKPKIIIIKDTESIIENFLLVEEMRRLLGPVTIIKISFNMDEAFDIDRIIYTRNLMVLDDREKSDAMKNPFSAIGDELRKANLSGMVYANKMSMTLIGAKYGPPNELVE